MLDATIPSAFFRLLFSFRGDRKDCLYLYNVFSSSPRLTQSLPQSSVLKPLLLLFHISNSDKSWSNDAVIELFTGNFLILCTSRKKGDAIASAQIEVTKVYNWRQKWKLNLKNLKADKSEVCQFYMWSNESK